MMKVRFETKLNEKCSMLTNRHCSCYILIADIPQCLYSICDHGNQKKVD